ncbi:hypothetical protein FKM82_018242 [Ascaphus truei]
MPRRAYNLNWFMRSRDIEGLVHSSWTRRGISGETRRGRQESHGDRSASAGGDLNSR